MRKEITPFGREIKVRLIDLGKNQAWLIKQIRERTGMYMDSSYMSKIQTGKLKSPRIVQAIKEILDISEG